MRIANRLVLVLCGALAVVLVVVMGVAQRAREARLREAFASEVETLAQTIRVTAGRTWQRGERGDLDEILAALERDPESYAAALVAADGRVLAGGPAPAVACLVRTYPELLGTPRGLRGRSACGGRTAWIALPGPAPGVEVIIARSTAVIENFIADSRRTFILTLLTLLGTTAAVIYLVLRRTLTVPLAKIVRGVHAMGQDSGEVRVAVGEGAGELHELAGAFNAMASRVERARREADRALRETEHAARARERFFAAAAHELKTPIGAITGYSELLEMGVHGAVSPQQQRVLGRIRQSGRHLAELVSDLLDLSRIEAGHLEIEPERLLLPELIGECLAIVRPEAERKRLALRTIPGAIAAVEVDPLRFKQILLNLLANAVKFTDHGGVSIAWGPGSGEAPGPTDPALFHVSVTDTGPGVPPEMRERIFAEFQQTELGRERHGAGLGLPIARRLARLMGGDVVLHTPHGGGSTFTVRLPVRPPPHPPP